MTTPHETHVSLVDLVVQFPGTTAVDSATLDVAPGEFFSLLGPSGCGKTTLLRTIAGFYRQRQGGIWFGDTRMDAVPAHKRDTGMVFQNYALFPHLTVAQNVAYGLRPRRVPRAEADERVRQALALVDLTGLEDRKPRQLSGGQQQRVAVARAVVIRPRVLSRSPTSTPSCACGSGPTCAPSRSASASPPSTSRTTRTRRSASPTASP